MVNGKWLNGKMEGVYLLIGFYDPGDLHPFTFLHMNQVDANGFSGE